jgi:hypothetical protein
MTSSLLVLVCQACGVSVDACDCTWLPKALAPLETSLPVQLCRCGRLAVHRGQLSLLESQQSTAAEPEKLPANPPADSSAERLNTAVRLVEVLHAELGEVQGLKDQVLQHEKVMLDDHRLGLLQLRALLQRLLKRVGMEAVKAVALLVVLLTPLACLNDGGPPASGDGGATAVKADVVAAARTALAQWQPTAQRAGIALREHRAPEARQALQELALLYATMEQAAPFVPAEDPVREGQATRWGQLSALRVQLDAASPRHRRRRRQLQGKAVRS